MPLRKVSADRSDERTLAKTGVSPYQIGELMGHTKTETTKIYAEFLPGSLHRVIEELD